MSTTCSLSDSCSSCAAYYPLRVRAPPLFPFAPQPFVYCAKVPTICSAQRSREKGDKPNYFLKAFHWYTQEHGGIKTKGEQQTVDGAQNIEFAAWLDNKYQQYLWDSKTTNPDNFRPEADNLPTLRPNQNAAATKSTKPKGFQRVLRSPWRKRRVAAESPEIGDSTECKSSWQIILRPKSLSRLESEICTKRRSACGASSRVTLTSSDTHIIVKTYSKRVELVVQEAIDTDNKEATNKMDGLSSQNTYTVENNSAEVKNLDAKVICDCPDDTYEAGVIEMGTQYDPTVNAPPTEMTTQLDNSNTTPLQPERPSCVKKNAEATTSTDKEKHLTIATGPEDKPPTQDKHTQDKPPCACKVQTPAPCCPIPENICDNYKQIIREHRESQRPACCPVYSADDSVQTSDHAITPVCRGDRGEKALADV